MAGEINISRPRLAEYIKQHAEVLARNCRIDMDLHEIETAGGTKGFIATVRVEFEDLPLEAVEVQGEVA